MLHFFRKHTSSLLVRIVLGSIALSFCFWGLGSLFYSKAQPENVVAYVGEMPITYQQIASQMDEANVAATARASAYPSFLHKHLTQVVLLREAQDSDIRVPDALVRHSIRALPFLHTEDGQFDGEKLQALLANGVIKKDALLSYAFGNIANKQMGVLFQSQDLFPPTFALKLFRTLHTQRDVRIYPFHTHTFAALITMESDLLATPEYKAFRQEQITKAKTTFVMGVSQPTCRKLRILHISKNYFPKQAVTPSDLKQALRDRFPPQEVRHLTYIEHSTEAAVQKALNEISQGNEPSDKDVTVERTTLVTGETHLQDWANQAAQYAKNVKQPIKKSDAGFFTVYVTNITEQSTTPKDAESLARIREDLQEIRRQSAADNLRTQIESSANTIEDLRKMAGENVRYIETAPLTQQGYTLQGIASEHLYGVPLDTSSMETVFTATPGQLDEPITLSDNSHIFFVVDEHQPAKVLPNDQIDDILIAFDFCDPKITATVKETATRASQTLVEKKSHNPADIGFRTEEAWDIKDQSLLGKNLPLPLEELLAIAATPVGSHICVFIDARPHLVLITKERTQDPSSNVEAYKGFKGWLSESMSREARENWARDLFKKHKVSIVKETFEKAMPTQQ